MERRILAVCLVLLAGLAGGCREAPEPAGETAAATAGETAGASSRRSYTVRGVLRQLPDPADPATSLLIHHAPIPDFVNSEGYETGMMSMTMPFPPAPGVELGGLEVGDAVEFTFEVDWEGSPPMRLTAIREIAPEELSGT